MDRALGGALLVTLSGVLACSSGHGESATGGGSDPGAAPATYTGHRLSPTRLLRRVTLALSGKQPTAAQYQQILAAKDDAARKKVIDAAVDTALASPEFYRQMVAFGHDYLNVGSFNLGTADGRWTANDSAYIERCPQGSKHAGAYADLGDPNYADPIKFCDDQDKDGNATTVPVAQVEPWWAPGTQVTVIGRLASGAKEHDGVDCGGPPSATQYSSTLPNDQNPTQCSCGPNLVYCLPVDPSLDGGSNPTDTDPWYHNSNYTEDSQRRQVFEEPARLFAHVVWNDRPLSDLVLGNYTVAPLWLRYLYVRYGRVTGIDKSTDDSKWWQTSQWKGKGDPEHQPGDPLGWQEVTLESLDPMLLALTPGGALGAGLDRTYAFDPRTDTGEPKGFGAAGVLTSAASMASFARERVRAARWLETFACRSFIPPPADETFNDYDGDPATSGICQHCHTTIDPAAVYFKRWGWGFSTPVFGGIGPFRWDKLPDYSDPRKRWDLAFEPDTVLTPVSEAQIKANGDARLIDFLPPDHKLFGLASDGTIGPLGFAKLLVQSGEFDACAVQKLYERFGGRRLDPATEQTKIDALVKVFVGNGRKVRPFVKSILGDTETFGRGI